MITTVTTRNASSCTTLQLKAEIARTDKRIATATNKGSKLSLQKKRKFLVGVMNEKLIYEAQHELHNLTRSLVHYKQPII